MANILTQAEKEERLGKFLTQAADTPFKWGHHDCGIWLADWVYVAFDRKIPDPAQPYRGKYTDDASAALLPFIGGWGGLPRIVDRLAKANGLARTRAPVAGDIGIINNGTVTVGAIRSNKGWIVIAPERGIMRVTEKQRLIAAWRV